MSKCDWDGGDCANASKPGPVAGYHSWSTYSSSSSDYCNAGWQLGHSGLAEREREREIVDRPSWLPSPFSVAFPLLGCLNSWVGDKYCDSSCRAPACGFDAGDCGVDMFSELYSISLTEESAPNQTFIIPLGK